MKKNYQQPSLEIIEMHGANLLQNIISVIVDPDNPATGEGLSNSFDDNFSFEEEQNDSTSHLWDRL